VRGKSYITCPVIAPDGHIVGRQMKTHLFGREHRRFAPGREIKIFRSVNVKFGCAICHDVVFAEVIRAMALKGAEIVFNPSKIVSEGLKPWRLYLSARSLENRIPILGVNVVAHEGGRRYPGGSALIMPFPVGKEILDVRPLKSLGRRPGLMTCEFDPKDMVRFRNERLREIRSDLRSD